MAPLRTAAVTCALALLALGVASAADSTQAYTLTVAGNGACSGFEVTNLPEKLSYRVSLASVGDSSCANSIRLSKFYSQGACISSRDNNIGFDSIKRITCPEASDVSTSTCQKIFTSGPPDARLNLTTLTVGQTFDSADLCGAESTGYVYVQSNCTSPTTLGISFTATKFNGVVCANIGGYHLSTAAIVGIVIAAIIVLVLLSWLVFCCCCGACCCCL